MSEEDKFFNFMFGLHVCDFPGVMTVVDCLVDYKMHGCYHFH